MLSKAEPCAIAVNGCHCAVLRWSPSLQVKVFDLHGKNYGFTLSPTYQPIAEDNCVAVASKTRKNILITMQVQRLLPALLCSGVL